MSTEHLPNDDNILKASSNLEEESSGDPSDIKRWLKARQTFTKLEDGLAELDALGFSYALKEIGKKSKRKKLGPKSE